MPDPGLAPVSGTLGTIQGFLFDMDGTLVDSSIAVTRVWRAFALRHGLDPERLYAAIVGCRAEDSIARFAPAGVDRAAETARVLAEELASTEGIVAMPGAAALLAGLPLDAWALVTSAARPLAERRMAAAGLPLPNVLITGDLVAAGKPAPDGFLAGALRLGVPIGQCLVVEDSPSGLAAGHAAGARVLAVGPGLDPAQRAREQWLPDFTHLQLRVRPGSHRAWSVIPIGLQGGISS